MANSFLSSWKKYTIYKWKHEQKHYTDHSLVFGKQKKKKIWNIILTTKS